MPTSPFIASIPSGFCFGSDYWQWIGRLPQHTAKVHAKYGDIVRLAPNELSFANPQAWTDIYAKLPGKEQWPRNPRRVPQGKNGLKSMMNTAGSDHARFRRLLNHAFSEKGLQKQQGLITKYIDLFIKRVDEFAQTGEPVDLTKWFGMVGFDIISDLGWSETFNCVKRGEPHSWMKTFVGTAFDTQLKFLFREHGLLWLAPFLIPMRLQLSRFENFKYARQRVEDRIQNGGIRGDFWDRIAIKSADDNASGEGLTKEEMIVAAVTLVGTGSETISTVLAGLVYFLGTNHYAMKKLVQEIRTSFASPAEINLVSVHKLTYLTACLNETMRLEEPQRVASSSQKELRSTCHLAELPKIPPTSIDLANTVLSVSCRTPPAEFAHDNKAAFHPFSMGAFNCLGQNLAQAEARLIMAKLLWHYDLEHGQKTPVDWLDQKSFAVFSKKELYVRFTRGQNLPPN
ncbi:cytochrome P450 [Penicillium malachiteum]|uniref:cytochrome P450 n=1 Tax=Penicillium malachiteum TaxID=1324776 RepID=UPI002547C8A3|nr:cytochrome P450 [Penicillium malachiteum]KAJ5714348.1 cytochrome P450 [Penicillium malachiteum]